MTADRSLADLHRRLGARLEDRDGAAVILDYGQPDEEHAALAGRAALIDRSGKGRLALTGADRRRFLAGLVTCDVKSLEPRRSVYGFFPSAQGKILADVAVLALEDRLWLELPAGASEAIAAHLAKYIIADQVEVFSLEEDHRLLTLAGPRSAAVLGTLTPLPEEDWSHRAATLAGVEVRIDRRPLAGVPAFTLWVGAAGAAAVAEALLATGDEVRPAGAAALERLRVGNGVPVFGTDFGPDHFPQESGLEAAAVSYTKGCYLGQEVIARIHYRGRANRAARRLLFEGEAPPPAGARLLHDGEEVGTVGSAVASPAAGGAVGIAVLHRKANAPGTRLDVDSGGRAEVAELPEFLF